MLFASCSGESYCIVSSVYDSKTVVVVVYSQFIKQQWNFSRWLTTDFLSVALWVIFDQEGNIMVVAHRIHYGPSVTYNANTLCQLHYTREYYNKTPPPPYTVSMLTMKPKSPFLCSCCHIMWPQY